MDCHLILSRSLMMAGERDRVQRRSRMCRQRILSLVVVQPRGRHVLHARQADGPPLTLPARCFIDHADMDFSGPYYTLDMTNKNPLNGRCFRQPIGAVSPRNLPRGSNPIEPLANRRVEASDVIR